MIWLALVGAITWGGMLFRDIARFDFSAHYTEWLNEVRFPLVLYSFPLGIIVMMAAFGVLAITRGKQSDEFGGEDI